jgi:uncharacterized protein with HEPN domain
MSRHDDAVRLRHMLDAARKALALVGYRSRAEMAADEVAQLALTRLLEIVGEAAGRVAPAYRSEHPELPWAAMVGLRNRLVHAYFDVDLDILLDIVAEDLPRLAKQLEVLLPANLRPPTQDGGDP